MIDDRVGHIDEAAALRACRICRRRPEAVQAEAVHVKPRRKSSRSMQGEAVASSGVRSIAARLGPTTQRDRGRSRGADCCCRGVDLPSSGRTASRGAGCGTGVRSRLAAQAVRTRLSTTPFMAGRNFPGRVLGASALGLHGSPASADAERTRRLWLHEVQHPRELWSLPPRSERRTVRQRGFRRR